ncbi:MAG TPA: nuclear transport factor 2 family protein [Gemmatimonadaceae bacterium]|nr:nuclear transport factor 2 family protein [Gemmatimonadaceae bacterium]
MTNFSGVRTLAMLTLLASVACKEAPKEITDAQRAAVVASVDSVLRAFEAAQRARDAEGAVALMASDFQMYTDGVRQAYDSIAHNIRTSFASMRFVEPGFSDISVRAMSPTVALTSFRFRDSLVTNSGELMRFTGATTLLWELRRGRWLMTHGHADHRPVR